MGLNYRGGQHDIPAEAELWKLDADLRVQSVKMRRLEKTASVTWWNGPGSRYAPSDLDHVLAAEHLKFRRFRKRQVAGLCPAERGLAEVKVQGWVNLPAAEQKRWIEEYSDHALLYFEVERV